MHRLMHQPAAVGCYPTMSVFHWPQVPPVPSLSVQLRMHVGRCRHAWFQATKCLRSPYYPRTRNDVQTEVPLVTIAVQRCRHRLLMPCSKRKGFMGATHSFLCTRASALASPALLESRSRPASRGSHACYPGAPHSGAGLMQILHHLAHPVVHAPVHAFVCRNTRSVMRASCTVRVDSTTGHSDDVLSSLLPVAGPRTGRASFDRIRLSSEHSCPGVRCHGWRP
jgi:hypothetical protein